VCVCVWGGCVCVCGVCVWFVVGVCTCVWCVCVADLFETIFYMVCSYLCYLLDQTTPKVMLCKAVKMNVCFRRGPILWNMGGSSFPRAFGRRMKFFLSGKYLFRIQETCKNKAVEPGSSLHRGPRLGTWRGFVYGDF
jgi:hypothetical protein